MSDNRFDTLEAGAPVSGIFLLKEKAMAQSKVGKRYLTLTLSDRRGDIEGKLWDEAEAVDAQLERMMPVHVEGVVTVYRDRPQITVRTIRVLPWNEDLASRLIPASRFELGELLTGLDRVLSTLTNPDLKALAETIRRDEKLMTRFSAVPAAKIMHHAYMRGLLEHTLSMLQIAAFAADHYGRMFPGLVDRDLLLVGTLLHDIGKIREYRFERGIDLTTEGRLIGHLVLGVELLDQVLATLPDFPVELEHRLKHLIVAHHGEPEKGAPVSPITLEALLLHFVDYMDSQINGAAMLLLQAGEDEYTVWSNKFERRFLNQRSNPATTASATPSLTPPAVPPAKPAGAPTPGPAEVPASRPPAMSASGSTEVPAARPPAISASGSTEVPAARAAEIPAEVQTQAPVPPRPSDAEDRLPFEAEVVTKESVEGTDASPSESDAKAIPEKEDTSPYPDEEVPSEPAEKKPPKKNRGPGLPGL